MASPADTVLQDLRREYDALLARVLLRLEMWVSLAILCTGIVAGLVLATNMAAGVPLPRGLLLLVGLFVVWYAAVHLLAVRGRYRGWMRYASSALDVTAATGVILVEAAGRGEPYAMSASGQGLLFLAVAASTLRLDPRLALFAGIFASIQSAAVFGWVLHPSAQGPMLAGEPHTVVLRSLWLLLAGFFGWLATRSIRGLVFRATAAALERERVRGLFGVYVSREIVDHILAGGVREGGERRSITVGFVDIRDFTRFAESRDPATVLHLLNAFFERMCGVVERHGGLVNKFLGDGMLVVFGAPTPLPDDASRAVAAAREMVAEAERMNLGGDFPGLRIGIGLHRGEAVLGNVGGPQRLEYTAIGDTVNTASRVQELTRGLGRAILLTSEVRSALPGRDYLPLGQHRVKGREQPLALFSPALPDEEVTQAS